MSPGSFLLTMDLLLVYGLRLLDRSNDMKPCHIRLKILLWKIVDIVDKIPGRSFFKWSRVPFSPESHSTLSWFLSSDKLTVALINNFRRCSVPHPSGETLPPQSLLDAVLLEIGMEHLLKCKISISRGHSKLYSFLCWDYFVSLALYAMYNLNFHSCFCFPSLREPNLLALQ